VLHATTCLEGDATMDTDKNSLVLNELSKLLAERGVRFEGELSPDRSLSEVGIDSLELALAFSHFEQHYEAEFDNDDIAHGRYNSIGDVVSKIAARIHVA
jgi:acyl carrier protein